MTQPVDATAYLKHANTLQAEAYAEMCTPEVQPVISPYGWVVTGNLRLFIGEYAENDAKQEAAHCGGTSKAVALYASPQPVMAPAQPLTNAQRCQIFDSIKYESEDGWEINFDDAVNAVECALINLAVARYAAQPVIAPALELTHKMIDTAYRKVWSTVTHRERLAAFAYEIEATITGRKQ